MKPISTYFRTSWQQYKEHIFPMAGYAFLFFGVLLLAYFIQDIFISIELRGNQLIVDRADIIWNYINRTISGVLFIWLSIAIVGTTFEIAAGHAPIMRIDKTLRMTLKFLIPAITIFILSTFAIFLGLLFLIIPGFIFSVWLSFVFYALIIEEKGILESFMRSKELVTGRFWDVFLRLTAFIIIIAAGLIVVDTLVTFIFSLIGFDLLGSMLVLGTSLLAGPYFSLLLAHLYMELRNAPTAPTATTPASE